MEIFRTFNVSGSGIDHDLLFCYRWMDCKIFFTYIISDGKDAASDGYFTSFITSDIAPVVFMLIFLALTAWIVFRGVEKGIEKFSRIIMPGLILLIVIIAIFH